MSPPTPGAGGAPRIPGAIGWSVLRWGRAVGSGTAACKEVVERLRTLTSVLPTNVFDVAVRCKEAIPPSVCETPHEFLRGYERAVLYLGAHASRPVSGENAGMAGVGNAVMASRAVMARNAGMAGVENAVMAPRAVMANHDCVNECTAEEANIDLSRCGPCDREDECSFNCAPRESIHDVMKNHLQRRLLGFLLREIHIAQDFIRDFCGEDETGAFWFQRWALQINTAILPLLPLYATITGDSKLKQMVESALTPDNPGTGVYVYARLNLRNHEMYIGETEHWNNRFKQHYKAMWKHSKTVSTTTPQEITVVATFQGILQQDEQYGDVITEVSVLENEMCRNNIRCRGCKEHKKYKKHVMNVPPQEWIMVPICEVADKNLAKKVERALIRKFKPNLNQSDKPFWLLKQNYNTMYKGKRGGTRTNKPPWKRPKTNDETQPDLPLYTTYEWDGQTTVDLANIFETHPEAGRSYWITVKRGQLDITNWKQMKRRYGESKVRVLQENTVYSGSLGEWKAGRIETCTFNIWLHRTEKINTKRLQSWCGVKKTGILGRLTFLAHFGGLASIFQRRNANFRRRLRRRPIFLRVHRPFGRLTFLMYHFLNAAPRL